MNCRGLLFMLSVIFISITGSQVTNLCFAQQKTYCNPVNIDYAYGAIPNFTEQRHRATADPVIVLYKDRYFLFSTNQYGYWHSDDMYNWKFVYREFLKPFHEVYDELCAPAAAALGDTLLLIGSTYTKDFPLYMSTNPTVDDWQEAVDSFQVGAWDPSLFYDDDKRLYIYFGSSNTFPIYGQEIDRKTFQPIGERQEMIKLHDEIHGWERFGEHADNTFLDPFIEGAWVNKYNGKYYLQYGAPGTEFSHYSDGVYISDKPLGPWKYQEHNPFAFKPGGFARGAGHGATYQDKFGNWWHTGTIAISVKNNFERRIGIWPAGFDKDDVLYCNTAYGDYPHYLPDGKADHMKSRFTGWMLLNYNKPVVVSSQLGGFAANFAVDENIKTYWSASSGNKGEWLQSDLGDVCTVNAVQINYADQDAELRGKQMNAFHQFILSGSVDGKNWKILADKSSNKTEVPHDYVELPEGVEARYIKLENVHVPTGKFAISGLRVFGKGNVSAPDTVQGFIGLRGDSERRNIWLKWMQSADAVGYNIYTGIAPDKLYNSIMVYNANEYYFIAADKNKAHYFQIEAFNEGGVGRRSSIIKIE